ncbi:MAG: porin [Desulfurellaceae bacterium]|nr:porin [Desulfurellaceae bacterium]
MRRLGLAFCVGLIAAGLLLARPAQAKNVAAEILDILKANGQISEQQYRDLMIKAQAEDEKVEAASGLTQKVEGLEKNVGKKNFLAAYWKSGLRLDSADGKFKLKVGGRIMNDWAVYSTDEELRRQFGRIGDGSEFRRARLFMEGSVYGNIKYKFQYDFASSDPFKDAYIQIKKVPMAGNFTVGHFKEPFSLEELTSSKYITFMERSLPNVFSSGRNLGVRLNRSFMDKRATAAFGFFRQGNPADTSSTFGNSGTYNATTRLTMLPWYVEKGRQLVHLGLSYRHAFHDENERIRFRQRPEAHLGPRLVETPRFHVEDVDYFAPEVALVYGPASLQFEWMSALADRPTGEDLHYNGYYIFGSFFLTGEHRPYKTSSGAFNRVKPKKNFDWKGGYGALELAARYSMIDLNDEDMNGGELSNFTFGVNWYLNPNVRIMLNYVRAMLDEDDCYYKGDMGDHCGDADIVQARFQVDF